MKLIDVLVAELAEWPNNEEYFTCDPDGEIRAGRDIRNDFYPKNEVDESDRTENMAGDSDDLPRVTRAEWEAARNA